MSPEIMRGGLVFEHGRRGGLLDKRVIGQSVKDAVTKEAKPAASSAAKLPHDVELSGLLRKTAVGPGNATRSPKPATRGRGVRLTPRGGRNLRKRGG